MPRNGSGVYSKPAGTTAVPQTTIESAVFNAVFDDIAIDLNAARPISSGGTGASTAGGIRTAINSAFSVDTFPDLIALTAMTAPAVGEFVEVKELGLRFQHVTSDGDVISNSLDWNILEDTADLFPIRGYGPSGSGDFAQDAQLTVQGVISKAYAGKLVTDNTARAHFPRGQYKPSASWGVSNFVRLSGDGPDATKFNAGATGVSAYPVFVNADAAGFNFTEWDGFSIIGGTSGLRIDATGGCDDLRIENVSFRGQTVAGIDFERFLQVAQLRNVNFELMPKGIIVRNATTNAVTLYGGSFKNLTDSALDLNGVEVLTCVGTRFEGGGVAGKYTLDLQNVRVVNFIGCYFENTHEYLLRARRTGAVGALLTTAGAISFQSCHFTYGPSASPYKWDVDGAIDFIDCNSTVAMRVPSQSVLTGQNRNITKAVRAGSLVAKQKTITALSNDLSTFNIGPAANALSNIAQLTARVDLSFAFVNTSGLGQTLISQSYALTVTAGGILGNMTASLVSLSNQTSGAGTISLSVKAGATPLTLTIEAVIAGISLASPATSVMGWTVTWDQVCGLSENLIEVVVPGW